MDPIEYLSFTSPNLVGDSHKQSLVSTRASRTFSFFFASTRVQGNSHAFFGGRIVLGPRWEGLTVSFSVLLVYFVQVIPLFGSTSQMIYIATLALFFLSFTLMLLTGLSNPGIIERGEDIADSTSVRVDSETGFLVPRFLLLNGVCVRQKFCRTCKQYRPPRSNHCSVCDNCVLKFDHHCAALGTCIGLGNYRWFISLVASLLLLQPLVFYIAYTNLGTLMFQMSNLNLLLLLVSSAFAFIAFLLLIVYHVFITAHNLTTNEHLKKYYKVNPFDYGILANCAHCLCYPQALLPISATPELAASYRELASTNSECISDFYDY